MPSAFEVNVTGEFLEAEMLRVASVATCNSIHAVMKVVMPLSITAANSESSRTCLWVGGALERSGTRYSSRLRVEAPVSSRSLGTGRAFKTPDASS